MYFPDTQHSLLIRLRDQEDRQAWEEFSRLYRQVIYRLAELYGLQDADADDLCQKVLVSVSQAIESYKPQPGVAKFRTWLKTIAKNEIINSLTRNPRANGREVALDTAVFLGLAAPEQNSQIELHYRREVFLVAAEQTKREFAERIWLAFWLTAVEERSIDAVSRELKMSRGSIYAARCRVMQRLREIVQRLEGQND